MESLRITWTLRNPMVVPNVPIHADALLSWAKVDEAQDSGANDPVAVQHDLPLERLVTDEGWCFKGSWLFIEWAGEPRILHMSRRSDSTEFSDAYESGLLGARRPGWDPASGPTKGYSLLFRERLVAKISCDVIGERQGIESLLPRVENIGKFARLGKGCVRDWSVETIPAEENRWMLRNLPARIEHIAGASAEGCLRAPYWRRGEGLVFVPLGIEFLAPKSGENHA